MRKQFTTKVDITDTFKPEHELTFRGICFKETKVSRNNFLLETLGATTRCCGCEKTQSVKNWNCACAKPWYSCEKYCRAGEVFRRVNANRAKERKGAIEKRRDPMRMQKQMKKSLNVLQKGGEIPLRKEADALHLRPKYTDEIRRTGINPNFLSPNLGSRFGCGEEQNEH